MRDKPLYVHSPIYPRRELLDEYIDRIYSSGWLTNNGPLVDELETALARYLDVPFLVLTANGTAALQIALKASAPVGEVITTPFTFPATGQAITWCGNGVSFADIDPDTLSLDPAQVARQIHPGTTAILPVNLYGTAHHTSEMEALARRHGLPLIYDSAHCFGPPTPAQKKALLAGNAAVLSFHATKIFNTVEGGAVITRDENLYRRAKAMINFGMVDGVPSPLGTNAKMNELEAAFGLANLEDLDSHLQRRRAVSALYRRELRPLVDAGHIRIIPSANDSYLPVRFHDPDQVTPFDASLARVDIFGRRYFHPLQPGCDTSRVPIAREVTRRIYCLPLHSHVAREDVQEICGILQDQLPRHRPTHALEMESRGPVLATGARS